MVDVQPETGKSYRGNVSRGHEHEETTPRLKVMPSLPAENLPVFASAQRVKHTLRTMAGAKQSKGAFFLWFLAGAFWGIVLGWVGIGAVLSHRAPCIEKSCRVTPSSHPSSSPPDAVPEGSLRARMRDAAVLSDPLFPPVGRAVDTVTYDATMAATARRMAVGRQEDTFRLLGYVTAPTTCDQRDSDAAGGHWRLFGRMRDRNQGEFYLAPADNNLELKVPLTTSNVVGSERLRDVSSIPNELSFDSPLLARGCAYVVTELPRGDLASRLYG